MSAPTSHDPVAVNTRDDRCWVRRGWSPDGHGLYALEGSAQDAEQTLYLIGDLAEFGLRSMTHLALPVPTGSERPDGLTRTFAPTQVLREDDEFHLRHTYLKGRDLPESGGAQRDGSKEPSQAAPKCRCDEPGADPYECEADPEDCSGHFSELSPFGGAGPVEGRDAKVSRRCGRCGWVTSVWHVDDGSAEEELHGHVVRVHGGVE